MLASAGLPSADEDESVIEHLGPAFELDASAPWIDRYQAAEIAGVPFEKLERLRRKNDGPPFVKVGVRVFYKGSQVRAWFHGRS